MFAAAAASGVGSAMCSYNKVGGTWACENPDTLLALKHTLNFSGWVMSDWGATHSTSINAGLDQEMPGGDFMGATTIRRWLACVMCFAHLVLDTCGCRCCDLICWWSWLGVTLARCAIGRCRGVR